MLKERILEVCNQLDVSVREFERSCGLGRGNISNMTGALGSDKLSKIIDTYPDINLYWLLTGEGESFKTKGAENVTLEKSNSKGNRNGNKRKLQNSLPNGEREIQQATPVILELPKGAVENGVAVPVLRVEAAAGSGAFNMD